MLERIGHKCVPELMIRSPQRFAFLSAVDLGRILA
jgi:hypothetical protein